MEDLNMTQLEIMGANAKKAARFLMTAGSKKDEALNAIASALIANSNTIIEANKIDIENGKNGLLVTPDDTQALSAAIRTLISSPDMRRKLGEQAKKDFREKHNYGQFIVKMNNIYKL